MGKLGNEGVAAVQPECRLRRTVIVAGRGCRSSKLLCLLLLVALASAATTARAAVIYVQPTGLDTNDGQSWATAKQTVTAGLAVAVAGDQVWVAAGTYVERITLKDAVALYGGFTGSEAQLETRGWRANPTILDGNQGGSVVTAPSGLTASTRIDGFVIRNGNVGNGLGGGVYCTSSAPTIAHCLITGNSAGNGGGIACAGTSASATIVDCQIAFNVAKSIGGGIYTTNTGVQTIVGNRIIGNSVTNAAGSGGGITCGSPAVIANNTIAGNSAKLGGGVRLAAPCQLVNNIVAFNSSGLNRLGSSPILSHNCVYNPDGADYTNLSPGTGDISVDPLLPGFAIGDVHLQAGSPCIDAGDDTVVQGDWTDVDGQARIQNGHVDIGADEFDGAAPAPMPKIVRVKSSGQDANSGADWASAKQTVQAGIDAVALAGGGEVWVAAGTYVQLLTLAAGAQVYGGFAGTETDRDQRDCAANATILDGAAKGSVVNVTSPGHRVSRIDGFTIRNGIGRFTNSNRYGGGVYCSGSAPVIANNLITGNTVKVGTPCGGGIYCVGLGSPLIEGNTLTGNTASGTTAYGAGIYCGTDATPVISGNTIAGNTVSGTNTYGGGISCSSASPLIRGNVIQDNAAAGTYSYGGGVHLLNAPALVSNNMIVGNRATYAADSSSGAGGGIYCKGSSPTISNNAINCNVADANDARGGGICCAAASPLIYGNRLVGNVASDYGGALDITDGAPVIANNTLLFSGAWWGGGICCWTSTPQIYNNIVAFGSSGLCVRSGTPVLRNNCVYNPRGENYVPATVGGTTDISVDPRIPDMGYGRAYLAADSPCVDAGDDTVIQAGWVDPDGGPRIQGTHVDIGAHEFAGAIPPFTPSVVRVSLSGDDAHDGADWISAKRTVQAGIDAVHAAGGGEVWVAEGTYYERVELKPWVYLYGGFAGLEISRDQRDLLTHQTVLDGEAAGVVVSASPGSAVSGLDGFTVQNGRASSGYAPAGVYCALSCPVVANNLITRNDGYLGAGVYCSRAWPVISGNAIVSNIGDGVYCDTSSPLIAGNTIAANLDLPYFTVGIYGFNFSSPTITGNTISDHAGTGILCAWDCFPIITKNTICRNTRGSDAGGIALLSCVSAVITDNIIVGNFGVSAGGIRFSGSSNILPAVPAVVTNNTIVANAGLKAGGIDGGNRAMMLANNVVAFNSSGILLGSGYGASVHHNCVYNPEGFNYSGIQPGAGDLQVDPRLVAPEFGQVHLLAGSPCIDAGDDASQPDMADIEGVPRPQGAHVDIGAREFNGTVPAFIAPVVRVSPNGNDADDGQTWATAKSTVQAAIDAAASTGGGEVWVAAGTYNERIRLAPFVYLYGGFAGSEVRREERDWTTQVTILDGNGEGAVVVAAYAGLAAVDGFHIRHGSASGLACYSTWLRVANNIITDNTASSYGGGVNVSGCCLSMVNNAILRNVTATSGGGVYCGSDSILKASGNVIAGNSAQNGGGVYVYAGSTATISNHLIVGNHAAERGGGAFLESGARLVNGTLAANSAGVAGAGIHAYSSSVSVLNSVVWGNAGPAVSYTSSMPTIKHCDIEGGYTGTGNTALDPRLARSPDPGPDTVWGTLDDDYGDLRLLAGSPCIDAGRNAEVAADIVTDLDGHGRFYNDPATPDCPYVKLGCGSPPVVDMGAYEFIAGDYDRDGDLDLDDFLVFSACASGPGLAYSGDCLRADLDRDNDVDQVDFGIFQRCFSGPGQPVDPACVK